MADYVCLLQEGVVRVPTYLTDADAASLPCAALTAWSALVTRGRIRAGDRVLVQGTGGVGLFALAFAKMQGTHVTVILSSDDRRARARAMDADETINYATSPAWPKASRRITAVRGGYGLIVELGGAQTLPLSLRAMRPGGTIALIGVLSGLEVALPLGPVVARQVRLQGVTVGHPSGFKAMLAAMAQQELRPVTGATFAFEELHAALHHQRKGGHFGKSLIRF